ncbi:magnesium transporter [candidate division WOR-3 bacterium]|nr:magnesium transporter [candidate division WOR-3 bacterium]
MQLLLPEVKELLENKDFDSLKALLSESEPVDIASLIEELPISLQVVLFNLLDLETSYEVFEHLDPRDEIEILKLLDENRAVKILNEMAPDERADLFEQLPEEDAKHFLAFMEAEEVKDVKELVKYPPETAGGIMTTEFAWVPDSVTTGDAIDFLRKQEVDFDFYQVYVLNKRKQLLGIIDLKDIIVSPPSTPIKKIMDKIPSVPLNMDQEKVSNLISKYDLPSIPVVDKNKSLHGIVTVDDVIDVIEDEYTEDAYKFGAAGKPPEDYLSTSTLNIAKSRIVWLIVLLLASFGSGFVIQSFSTVLQKMVTLAIFIPLLLGCAGNAGIQAASVVIRGLATAEIKLSHIWRVVRKEFLIGILVGIGLGIVASIRAFAGQRALMLGLTVGLSMTAAITVATTLGGLLPIVFKKLGFDPALTSGPLVTTIMDITSLLIYFSVAVKIMQ